MAVCPRKERGPADGESHRHSADGGEKASLKARAGRRRDITASATGHRVGAGGSVSRTRKDKVLAGTTAFSYDSAIMLIKFPVCHKALASRRNVKFIPALRNFFARRHSRPQPHFVDFAHERLHRIDAPANAIHLRTDREGSWSLQDGFPRTERADIRNPAIVVHDSFAGFRFPRYSELMPCAVGNCDACHMIFVVDPQPQLVVPVELKC
mmetsp:Transcript_25842/g.85034  ORF Transcript_25842/g.85034 Transcript_25842/m.85034 type:complete len:210 (-) Transcript_25842:1755-2384(-)